ncbi:hypothetical protein [Nocardioides plantarum]|uniref:Uncharacterized protein n=1 Tax=Nocardioides plantarum TaxID=29299 RepID=A0ABV5KFQ6_9ACTN|nr:hypothetical protein [Nocardioides plantarum]
MRRLISLSTLVALVALVLVTLASTLTGTSATAASRTSTASKAVPATKVVYVRPVTSSGRPASGWTVTRESGSVSCDGPSPSAVNPGITSCYPTAYGLAACFKSSGHTVLCVRDATSRSLVRIAYQGTYPKVNAPARPTPANLVLSDGRRCQVRTGGAWSSPAQHPDWVGFSSCTSHASTYGSGLGNGIDARKPAWTVRLWRTSADPDGRDLLTRRVVTAYVVGLAAD